MLTLLLFFVWYFSNLFTLSLVVLIFQEHVHTSIGCFDISGTCSHFYWLFWYFSSQFYWKFSYLRNTFGMGSTTVWFFSVEISHRTCRSKWVSNKDDDGLGSGHQKMCLTPLPPTLLGTASQYYNIFNIYYVYIWVLENEINLIAK